MPRGNPRICCHNSYAMTNMPQGNPRSHNYIGHNYMPQGNPRSLLTPHAHPDAISLKHCQRTKKKQIDGRAGGWAGGRGGAGPTDRRTEGRMARMRPTTGPSDPRTLRVSANGRSYAHRFFFRFFFAHGQQRHHHDAGEDEADAAEYQRDEDRDDEHDDLGRRRHPACTLHIGPRLPWATKMCRP